MGRYVDDECANGDAPTHIPHGSTGEMERQVRAGIDKKYFLVYSC